jgi:hypothetical protein
LDDNSAAYKSLINVHKKIMEIQDQFDNSTFDIQLLELLKMKHNAIQKLYQYITDNIEKEL